MNQKKENTGNSFGKINIDQIDTFGKDNIPVKTLEWEDDKDESDI